VAASTPVAAVTELHAMRVEGGIMKMQPVDGVELPANRTVRLAPNGHHIMMQGLKQPLKPGDRIPLRLTFEMRDGGTRDTLDVSVEIRELTGAPREHGHRHGH
jgi:copper(I)-binding protein